MTEEISEMVDIQFSAYHYKTGDIQLLKHRKYIEIKKNPLPPPARCLLCFDIFRGDFGIIQKTVY